MASSMPRQVWGDRTRDESVLGDSKAVRHSKTYRKWDSMMQRGLESFLEAYPQTFLRRLRRGAPQDFRWEIWKVLLQSKVSSSKGPSSPTFKPSSVTPVGTPRQSSRSPLSPGEPGAPGQQQSPAASDHSPIIIRLSPTTTSSSNLSASQLPHTVASQEEDGRHSQEGITPSTDGDVLDPCPNPSSSSAPSSATRRSASPSKKIVGGLGCYASPHGLIASEQDYPSSSQTVSSLSNLTTRQYLDLAYSHSPYLNLINIDIPRTFPELPSFDSTVQRQLARILNAFANYKPVVGYCQGMNFVAGFLLLVSGFREFEVFSAMTILFNHYGVEGLFRENFPLLIKYIEVYSAVASDSLPALWTHFTEEGVLPPVYLHQWFLTLYVRGLPLRTTAVIWDFLLAEGLPGLIPLTVALLKVLQRFLLRLRFEDAVKFLRSLKNSGDCDETEIGRMLVRQAEKVEIPLELMESLLDLDIEALVEQLDKKRSDAATVHPSTRLVPITPGLELLEAEAGCKPNPLLQCVASEDDEEQDNEFHEDETEYHYIRFPVEEEEEKDEFGRKRILNGVTGLSGNKDSSRSGSTAEQKYSILSRKISGPQRQRQLSEPRIGEEPVESAITGGDDPRIVALKTLGYTFLGHPTSEPPLADPSSEPADESTDRESHRTAVPPSSAHSSHPSPPTCPRTYPALGYPASSAWASSGYRSYRSLSRSLFYPNGGARPSYPTGGARPSHPTNGQADTLITPPSQLARTSRSSQFAVSQCHTQERPPSLPSSPPPSPLTSWTNVYQSPLWKFSCSFSMSEESQTPHSFSEPLLSVVERPRYTEYSSSSLSSPLIRPGAIITESVAAKASAPNHRGQQAAQEERQPVLSPLQPAHSLPNQGRRGSKTNSTTSTTSPTVPSHRSERQSPPKFVSQLMHQAASRFF